MRTILPSAASTKSEASITASTESSSSLPGVTMTVRPESPSRCSASAIHSVSVSTMTRSNNCLRRSGSAAKAAVSSASMRTG